MIINRAIAILATGALGLALTAGCGASTPPTVAPPTPAIVSASQPPTVTLTSTTSPTPVSTLPPAAVGASQTNAAGTVATVYSVTDWTPPESGSTSYDDPGVVVDAQIDFNTTKVGDSLSSNSWSLTDPQNHVYTASYSGPAPHYPDSQNAVM
jgi:hypothetical protein